MPRVLYALALDPGEKFGSLEEQIVYLGQAFHTEGSLFLPLFSCAAASANVDQFLRRGLAAECLDLSRFTLSTAWRLWRLVRRRRIDLVHWNFVAPIRNPYVWSLTALAPGVAHALTDHNSRLLPLPQPSTGWRRRVKKILLSRYRQVWGVSDYVRDHLADQGTWSNVVSCRHFINTERFRPDEQSRRALRGELDAGERFVLVTVANLIPEKGIDLAIDALALLPDGAVLWVIGQGPESERLEERIAARGLEARVRLLGLKRHVQPYLQAADCFVCPSRWAEAAGLVNLEAHACGLPIVASRIGGIPEYVKAGATGLLFEPGDAADLARQISSLMTDRDLCRTMSAAARRWALEEFSPAARLPAILDLYRDMRR